MIRAALCLVLIGTAPVLAACTGQTPQESAEEAAAKRLIVFHDGTEAGRQAVRKAATGFGGTVIYDLQTIPAMTIAFPDLPGTARAERGLAKLPQVMQVQRDSIQHLDRG